MQSAMAALAASAHFWLWFWEKFELPSSIIIKVLERNTLLGLLKCVYIDERWYFRVIIVFWHCSMETLNCVIGGQAWKTRNSKLPPFFASVHNFVFAKSQTLIAWKMFQSMHFRKTAKELGMDPATYEKEYNYFLAKLKKFHESKG